MVDFYLCEFELFIWEGNVDDRPSDPTFLLPAFKNNPASTEIAIEISDYIIPFLNPLPNESYFTGITGNFGEFVNFQYANTVYYDEGAISSYMSDPYLVCLGYGKNPELANPQINIVDDKLIDYSKRFSLDDVNVYDVLLNDTTDSSSTIINRSYTTNYKRICPKIYKPRQIMFLNKNGLLDTFLFPRVSSNKLKSTSEKYNQTTYLGNNNTQDVVLAYDYKLIDNFNIIHNKNGNQEWVFNTDHLDEYNISIIEQLFASDRHWLVDYQHNCFIPLQLSDDNFERKTDVNDRGKKAYTVKFVESNDYIQNIR